MRTKIVGDAHVDELPGGSNGRAAARRAADENRPRDSNRSMPFQGDSTAWNAGRNSASTSMRARSPVGLGLGRCERPV